MNAPIPIRAKLMVAALSLLAVFGFGLFSNIEAQNAGWIAFRAACFLFGAFVVFGGIFSNAQLQGLWGGGLALAVALLIVLLCVGFIPASARLWAAVPAAAASVGAYLLLLDADIKIYRQNIRRKNDA